MPKYIAKRNVKIDGQLFSAGETITGVSDDRCQHLLGRFVEVSGDAAEDADEDVEIEKMTVAEMEAFAADLGIELPSGSKAEKVAYLKKAVEG